MFSWRQQKKKRVFCASREKQGGSGDAANAAGAAGRARWSSFATPLVDGSRRPPASTSPRVDRAIDGRPLRSVGPLANFCFRRGTDDRTFVLRSALATLCRRYRIRKLSLFGSTLKGANRPDSDVDLLVEFEPEATPGLFTMVEIELALSPLLEGRKVDLRTAGDLSRYFRDEGVRMAEPQYEAG
jgi:uncharacterized protein